MSISELYWQAGMFEGEGSIRISKPNRTNWGYLCVDLANTDKTIVNIFQQMWGGRIAYYEPGGNRKPYWRWRCYAIAARDFLRCMWPCLLTDKYRHRCVVGMDFQDQKESNRSDIEYRNRQWMFYSRMKVLNHRGVR